MPCGGMCTMLRQINAFVLVSHLKFYFCIPCGGKISCIIVEDFSLRCFGGGNSDVVENLAPTESVVYGFGNYGQIGSGDNETLGDEVSARLAPCLPCVRECDSWIGSLVVWELMVPLGDALSTVTACTLKAGSSMNDHVIHRRKWANLISRRPIKPLSSNALWIFAVLGRRDGFCVGRSRPGR